jgi:two-component system, cell cycle sensor histidine kinase and response regulator CckA
MKPSDLFVFENAGWPALLVDQAGSVLRANDAAVKAFGAVIEVPGSQLTSIWATENPQSIAVFFANWQRTPVPTVMLKFKWKGGGVAAHTVSICSFQRDDQRYFLLQMPGELASPDAALQKQKLDCALQLARTVSLDFNNALTTILGHTSLILGRIEPGHPWRASLLEVERSAERAAEISCDLGTFSLQEKEVRSQATGNVNELIQRSVDLFQKNPTTVPVKWVLNLERRLFLAKFDEVKMLQALMKVIENATEAVAGGGQVTLQTRNVELKEATQDRGVRLAPGNYVCLEVSDTGTGIEPDILPRVFEPFFTTKRNHRGLGLAWVYGIVTNHGGGVAISSQPGTGTSVRLYLPSEQNLIRETVSGGEDLTGSQTLLVVDDEDMLLTMAQMILGSYGYKVLTANSGQKALAILAKGDTAIDLLVTDLVMPVMSGRELMEQARKLAPQMQILCMSGYARTIGREEDATHLQKPFTSQDLLQKVKRLLSSGNRSS